MIQNQNCDFDGIAHTVHQTFELSNWYQILCYSLRPLPQDEYQQDWDYSTWGCTFCSWKTLEEKQY